MDTFGFKLKEARKAKGLTQKQLAALIGVKHNSISNWENNQNKPDIDVVELICGALDIEPNDIMPKPPAEKIDAWRTESDKTYEPLMVNKTERKIVENYRLADPYDKTTVLRALHMDDYAEDIITTSNANNITKLPKKKYIPTEEDIQSLVARNGKKFTREEAIGFISNMLSEDDDDEE